MVVASSAGTSQHFWHMEVAI